MKRSTFKTAAVAAGTVALVAALAACAESARTHAPVLACLLAHKTA